MNALLSHVLTLEKSPVGTTVRQRIREFSSFGNKSSQHWFSELCFCILAANAKGRVAYDIQRALGVQGCCSASRARVRKCIMSHKHRFHNNKTRFIIEARKHADIKGTVQSLVKKEGQALTREWLVKNIKGLGYKEASHFLRNVGYPDVAIIDRHVLNVLAENRIIQKPKTLSPKTYLWIEAKLAKLAKQLHMRIGELDLYLWYMKAGEVLK